MPGLDAHTVSQSAASIRAFICLDIPQSVKQRIDALQRDLRQIGAQVSWVKPDNIHLTLKFLGDVAESRIESIRKAVEIAARATRALEIEVAGTGCFPSPRNPRVLWIGLSDMEGKLAELHRAIESELARERFPREPKKFSPHLTIGRVRAPHNAALVAEELISRGFEPHNFQADEIIVMRSDLKPTGPIYTPLARIKL